MHTDALFSGVHLEPVTGFQIRPFSGVHGTVLHFTLSNGTTTPGHSHPHEQYTVVISGRLQYVLGEESQVLQAGDVVHVPSDVWHEATALEDAVVLEFFHPVRQDLMDKFAQL